ncbi:hypothetical protein M432DRAFT_78419 [Thermoascus aurantiacus ATCC 26904]
MFSRPRSGPDEGPKKSNLRQHRSPRGGWLAWHGDPLCFLYLCSSAGTLWPGTRVSWPAAMRRPCSWPRLQLFTATFLHLGLFVALMLLSLHRLLLDPTGARSCTIDLISRDLCGHVTAVHMGVRACERPATFRAGRLDVPRPPLVRL